MFEHIENIQVEKLLGKENPKKFSVTTVSIKHEMPEMEMMMEATMPSVQAHPGSQMQHVGMMSDTEMPMKKGMKKMGK